MKKLTANKKMNPVVAVLFAFLVIYSASLLFMYLWGFFTSLKTNSEFRQNMYFIPSGWPWGWEWANYKKAFETLYVPVTVNGMRRNVFVLEMFGNSALYAFSGALINVFTTWMVAYLLAKFPYKFSKFIYTLNIILMVVPIIGSLPSALQIKKALGLYDNWWFVFTGGVHFTGMYLLIFHSFHRGIGKEFSEAAYVDGASNLSTMLKIIFPISLQMFFVVTLMIFIQRWNDYMTMVIWMPNHPTLAYGIYRFSTVTTTVASWPPLQITGCVLLMLPILLLFLLFQDFMMSNLRMGAVKG